MCRSFDQLGEIGPTHYKPGKDANLLTFCNPNLPGNGSTVLDITVSQLRQPLNQVGAAEWHGRVKTDDPRAVVGIQATHCCKHVCLTI
jgi:hypothetical protein